MSSFQAELNRLAHTTFNTSIKEGAGAANVLAYTWGVELVGALNMVAVPPTVGAGFNAAIQSIASFYGGSDTSEQDQALDGISTEAILGGGYFLAETGDPLLTEADEAFMVESDWLLLDETSGDVLLGEDSGALLSEPAWALWLEAGDSLLTETGGLLLIGGA